MVAGVAMADSKSANPLGYIAIGFSLNGEASTTGNPDVYSYLIKKFRQKFDGDELISKTNTAVNSITKKYKAPMINRIQQKAIDEGMISLRRSGLRKIMDGATSVEEVVRETVL